jgi:hypothetical protein
MNGADILGNERLLKIKKFPACCAGIYPSGCIYHSIVLDRVDAFRTVVSISLENFPIDSRGGYTESGIQGAIKTHRLKPGATHIKPACAG